MGVPRILTSRAYYGWRSLKPESSLPLTSHVALQAPPVARLQPIGSCDSVFALAGRPLRTNTARLTCIARTATYTSGKGRTAISPRRLPPYSDTTNFRQQPSACARRGESIRANLTHRFAFYPPLSVTFRCRRRSRQRIEASFRLAHALQLVLRLTVITRIRMRPNRLLPPNTFFDYEHPRLVRSRCGSHATFASRCSGDRAFHDARFASADPAALFRGGRFLPPVFPRASEPYLWHLCRLPASERAALSHALFVIRAAEIASTARP